MIRAAGTTGRPDSEAGRTRRFRKVSQPHIAPLLASLTRVCTERDAHNGRWGGRGSNPRLADYESAALTD